MVALSLNGTTPPTHVAGLLHKPPIEVEVIELGTDETSEILSTETGGCVPVEVSLFHKKISLKVVPAKDAGSVTVMVCTPVVPGAVLITKVAPAIDVGTFEVPLPG